MNTQLDSKLICEIRDLLIGKKSNENGSIRLRKPVLFRYVNRQTGEVVKMPNGKYEWKGKNHAKSALRRYVHQVVWPWYMYQEKITSSKDRKQIENDLMDFVLSEMLELREYTYDKT